VIGAPIEVVDLDPETARRLVEDRLNELTIYADRLVGVPTIDPEAEPNHASA